MKYSIHKQLLKEFFADIKYYFNIYLEYEDKNLNYLYDKLKHSFIIYFHKLKTEKMIFKRAKKKLDIED